MFSAGWTVTMIGLDVTLHARADAAVRDRLRTLGPLADHLLLPSLAGYRATGPAGPGQAGPGRAGPGPAGPGDPRLPAELNWPDHLLDPAVHDVCAVACVTRPS